MSTCVESTGPVTGLQYRLHCGQPGLRASQSNSISRRQGDQVGRPGGKVQVCGASSRCITAHHSQPCCGARTTAPGALHCAAAALGPLRTGPGGEVAWRQTGHSSLMWCSAGWPGGRRINWCLRFYVEMFCSFVDATQQVLIPLKKCGQ